jgi:hypothetical protein
LQKPSIVGIDLNDEDKAGFMMAVHGMDRSNGLDLILHTPGGSIAAAESIVDYLRRMFDNDIRAIVPQLAMSAGTMLACSCKEIWMGKPSSLGPVDPQIRGLPAQGVLDEFKRAYDEIVKDADKVKIWSNIIGKYPPSYIQQCEQAVRWAKEFVTRQLEENMFSALPDKRARAQRAVTRLTDFGGNRSHDRHISIDECKNMGLIIKDIESDDTLQDLILTIHHCYMFALANTPTFKIVENQLNAAFLKQQIQGIMQMPVQNPMQLPQF